MTFDGKAFGAEIVSAVKAHISDVVAPLIARLDAIEAKHATHAGAADAAVGSIRSELEALAKTVADIPEPVEPPPLPDVAGMISEAIAAIPEPSATPTVQEFGEVIAAQVAEAEARLAAAAPALVKTAVDAAIAELPPVEAKEVDIDALHRHVEERVVHHTAGLNDAVKAAVEAMPPVEPEKVDREEVAALVKSEAERILSTWERPEDGKSVTVDDVAPLIAEQVAKTVAAIPVPKDGCGIKDVIIDREGSLVFTMDDGRMKNLGLVVGQDCDMEAVEARVKALFEDMPKPRDGIDGVGFDHMDLEFRGNGAFIVFTMGDVVKEARLPLPIYRGVWQDGTDYRIGDTVTWGGSAWIAEADTKAKPDAPNSGWRLAVKKGRDAKDIDKAAIEAIVKGVLATQKKRGD